MTLLLMLLTGILGFILGAASVIAVKAGDYEDEKEAGWAGKLPPAHAWTIETRVGAMTGQPYYFGVCSCSWKSGGYSVRDAAERSGSQHAGAYCEATP